MLDLDRRIAKLAIPALGSIAAEPLYNLADTAIVGHLGRSPLDALALAVSVLSVVAWLAIFLSTATTTEVARNIAQGADRAAARAVGAAYAVAAGWGAVTAAALALLAPYAVWLLGGRGTIGPAATEYARISAIGLPFLYLSFAGNGHLTGQQDTRTPLRIAVGANVINIALEALLVFGLHAGLAGLGLGHGRGAGHRRRRLRPGVAAVRASACRAVPVRHRGAAARRPPAVGPDDRARRGAAGGDRGRRQGRGGPAGRAAGRVPDLVPAVALAGRARGPGPGLRQRRARHRRPRGGPTGGAPHARARAGRGGRAGGGHRRVRVGGCGRSPPTRPSATTRSSRCCAPR